VDTYISTVCTDPWWFHVPTDAGSYRQHDDEER
jgi:hypothetical protein